MHRTILLMICLISVASADAQRQRMTSEVYCIYGSGRWWPVDSSAYTYNGSMGSVDTGGHHRALGFDTRTSYYTDKGKYYPSDWESIDYDSAGHPVLYTFQTYDHKKWVNKERYALSYSRQEDTLSYAHEEYDVKQKSWHPVESMLYSYDSRRRCITRTRWGTPDRGPYPPITTEEFGYEPQEQITTMDSFIYDERGLLSQCSHLRWDTSMNWQPSQREIYEYNAAGKLASENCIIGTNSLMHKMIYDSAERLLSEYWYNGYIPSDQYSRLSMTAYGYDGTHSVVKSYYNPDNTSSGWHLMSTDSTCYDMHEHVIGDMHLDFAADSNASGYCIIINYDSLGAFKFRVSYIQRTGGPLTPVEKSEVTRDIHGLMTSKIISRYTNGRWEYKEATFYKYEPVPDR